MFFSPSIYYWSRQSGASFAPQKARIWERKREKNEEKVNIEALTNVEALETELKEEYKEEMAATEEAMSDKELEVSIDDNLELLKEYSDTNKKIEEITNESDINEIGERIIDELEKSENLKEELSKNIAEAEKTLNEKQKEVFDKAAKGRAFLNFWNGVSYDA